MTECPGCRGEAGQPATRRRAGRGLLLPPLERGGTRRVGRARPGATLFLRGVRRCAGRAACAGLADAWPVL